MCMIGSSYLINVQQWECLTENATCLKKCKQVWKNQFLGMKLTIYLKLCMIIVMSEINYIFQSNWKQKVKPWFLREGMLEVSKQQCPLVFQKYLFGVLERKILFGLTYSVSLDILGPMEFTCSPQLRYPLFHPRYIECTINNWDPEAQLDKLFKLGINIINQEYYSWLGKIKIKYPESLKKYQFGNI